MQTSPRAANPFALLLNPQAVIAQIEGSERLERLHRRVCRPLDKPLLDGAATGEVDDDANNTSDDSGSDTGHGF